MFPVLLGKLQAHLLKTRIASASAVLGLVRT